MKHLNNKMIADYILKTGSKEELDRLKTHIESCEICRKKSREIARIYQSSDNNSITPSAELQNRILATQRKSTTIRFRPHGRRKANIIRAFWLLQHR